MKKVASISAIALAIGMSSAFAADLPSHKAPVYVPPPPPPLTWNGFYAGVNVGGGWNSNSVNQVYAPYWDPRYSFASNVTPTGATNLFFLPGSSNFNGTSGGVVGGGQVGYNFQFNPSVLVGVETDFQGSSIGNNNKSEAAPFYASPLAAGGLLVPLVATGGGHAGIDWIGTVRGRAGWLFTPSLLVYGTAGFAYAGVYAGNYNNTRTGWTAGGGLEYMFTSNISAKIEYLYADLSSGGQTGGWGWNYGNHRHPQLNIVRAGVNYHFNWAAPAPVLAKY